MKRGGARKRRGGEGLNEEKERTSKAEVLLRRGGITTSGKDARVREKVLIRERKV